MGSYVFKLKKSGAQVYFNALVYTEEAIEFTSKITTLLFKPFSLF